MCALETRLPTPARWRLSALLLAWASLAQVLWAGAQAPPSGAARPAPAAKQALPAAFAKPAPVSVADLRMMEQHVKALVAKLSPAVVAVEIGQASGSGVVISTNGLVLTAGHVCGRAGREVRYTFPDGRTARGKTLGANSASDAGLMQITDRGTWPCVGVGELENARVGDWVLALGLPGGFDVKRSLITRLGRIIQLSPDALQTDCTISPGDSGGALFDMHGRVIGIHSFISTGATENFHVPITRFFESWDRMVNGGRASDPHASPRAYVGADAVDDSSGCRLEKIAANGPAAKAGLKVGDVVRKVDGREIRLAVVFQRWVAEARPGETLDLEVSRAGKTLSISLKVEAPPSGS